MLPNDFTQRTFPNVLTNYYRSLRARGRSDSTIGYYQCKLSKVSAVWNGRLCEDISASEIREVLIELQKNHNPGGVHSFYRAIRAFFYWYEDEYQPLGWINPMRKIKAPHVPEKILDPVTDEQLEKLLQVCNRQSWHGVRDRAVFLTLNATGIRASELTSLKINDVDLVVSAMFIQQGKGGYPRALDYDKRTKAAIKAFLLLRGECEVRDTATLFISDEGNALGNDSLRQILSTHIKNAGLPHLTPHMFRRKHALDLYRAGRSREFIAARLGHHGTAVVDRYIKLSPREMIERSLVYK